MAPVRSDVYYCPTFMGKRRFFKSDLNLDCNFEERQAPNTKLFKEFLTDLFKKSRKDTEDYAWDYSVFQKGERTLKSLFEDYKLRTRLINGQGDEAGRHIRWLCSTFMNIVEVYESHPRIFVSVHLRDRVFSSSYEYRFFCDYLLYSLVNHVLKTIQVPELMPSADTSLSILYNSYRWGEYWGSNFDEWYSKLYPLRISLTDPEYCAIVYPIRNEEWTRQRINRDVDYYFDNEEYSVYSTMPDEVNDVSDVFEIRQMFYDYQRRVHNVFKEETKENEKRKFSLLYSWCMKTFNLAVEMCDSHKRGNTFLFDEERENSNYVWNSYVLEVFMHCCCYHLVDIISAFLTNAHELSIMDSSEVEVSQAITHYEESTELKRQEDIGPERFTSLRFDSGITREQIIVIGKTIDDFVQLQIINNKQIGAEVFLYFAALLHYKHLSDLSVSDMSRLYKEVKGKSNVSRYLGKQNGGGLYRNVIDPGIINDFKNCIATINRNLEDARLAPLPL